MTELSDYRRMVEQPMIDGYNAKIKKMAAQIESDAKVIAALREKLKLMDDYYQTGGDLMSHMAHMAQDALAVIEQTAEESK